MEEAVTDESVETSDRETSEDINVEDSIEDKSTEYSTSENEEGLEEIIEDLEREAEKYSGFYDVDRKEYVINALPKNIVKYLGRKGTIRPKVSSQEKGPKDGAVVMIFYRNPETGEIEEVLHEQNRFGYPREPGQYRPFGGAIEEEDKSPLYAAMREIREEFTDRIAQDTIIKALMENPELYDVVTSIVDGKIVRTYFFKVELPKNKFRRVKASDTTDGAGIPRAFSRKTTLELPDQYYAFGAELIKGAIDNNYRQQNLNFRVFPT